MIIKGQEACDATGIPSLHAEAFQEVADKTGNVIASRAVGKYATGLILESYSSKGFHNKAKSCNWGPMAGFVLNDPKFTKVGGTAKGQAEQKEALLHAIEANAIEVPLFISEDRRKWLEKNLLSKDVKKVGSDTYELSGTAPWGLKLDFKLMREKPNGATGDMWGVRYRSADAESARGSGGLGEWTRVMAMRDPLCVVSASDYRSATTGDYDLFAIWAPTGQYSPDNADKRMVSHSTLETNIKKKLSDTGEDAHLGNMTGRIREVRDALNTAIQRRGYTGGDMIHHSDEGGRPFVGDVDLPIFAVVPKNTEPFVLEEVPDLRQFITSVLNQKYAPVFNPGWMKELVPTAALIKDHFSGNK